MTTSFLPNGLGGLTGATFAIVKPLYISGKAYYVDSQTGNASNTGLDRKMPLLTVAAAVTASSAGDVIVLLDGHTEVVTAAIAVNKQLSIVGEGSASGVPTVSMTLNHATADLFTVSGSHCEIYNILCPVPSQATTGSIFTITGAGCMLDNVHINVNDENNAHAVAATANHLELVNCVFTSTETDTTPTAKPYPAVLIAGDIIGLRMSGVVFDAGTVGFENATASNWAFESDTYKITGLHVSGLSLLRGATLKINSTSVGQVNVGTATGSAGVEW